MEEFRTLIQRARESDLSSFSETEMDQCLQLCKTIEKVEQPSECNVDLLFQNTLPTQWNCENSSSGGLWAWLSVSNERYRSFVCPT